MFGWYIAKLISENMEGNSEIFFLLIFKISCMLYKINYFINKYKSK